MTELQRACAGNIELEAPGAAADVDKATLFGAFDETMQHMISRIENNF